MQLLFTQPIEQRVNEMIAGIRGDVGVKIFGDDFERLTGYAEEVAATLRRIRGAVDVATDQLSLLPVVRIEVDEDATARYGVARRDVLASIQALGTPQAGEVREGQRRFPLVVRLAEPFRRDWEALGQLLVNTPSGARLPLSRLARIVEVSTPATISRDRSQRRTLVQCNVRGRDVGSFVAEAQTKIGRLSRAWASGYSVAWGGQFEEMLRRKAAGDRGAPGGHLDPRAALRQFWINARCAVDLQRRAVRRRGRSGGAGSARDAVFDFGRRRLCGLVRHRGAERIGTRFVYPQAAGRRRRNPARRFSALRCCGCGRC